jgi:Tol biopolymer transport system component
MVLLGSEAHDGVARSSGAPHVDLVNVQTRERRVLIQASSYLSAPRWSPNGEWMMYTRRGPRHWWSKAEWTGSEPSQILVRNVKSGTEASIGECFKANPGDYTWVSNRELCRASTAQ